VLIGVQRLVCDLIGFWWVDLLNQDLIDPVCRHKSEVGAACLVDACHDLAWVVVVSDGHLGLNRFVKRGVLLFVG